MPTTPNAVLADPTPTNRAFLMPDAREALLPPMEINVNTTLYILTTRAIVTALLHYV
jgi:type IV secretory pathway VirB9-like protein